MSNSKSFCQKYLEALSKLDTEKVFRKCSNTYNQDYSREASLSCIAQYERINTYRKACDFQIRINNEITNKGQEKG